MLCFVQGERFGTSQTHRLRAPALEPAAERGARAADAAGAALRGALQAQAALRAAGARQLYRL